tara:strand:+ start:365 stop:784 length:420 start_codon:yes stop_codon:yes gene_type:complete
MAVGLYGGDGGQQSWIDDNFNQSSASQYAPPGGGTGFGANPIPGGTNPLPGGNDVKSQKNFFDLLSEEEKQKFLQGGQGIPGQEENGFTQPQRGSDPMSKVMDGFDFGNNKLRPGIKKLGQGLMGMVGGAFGGGFGGGV